MRTVILALSFTATTAAMAQAQTIAAIDAKARVGQTVTVEGTVSDVHFGRSGAAFIDVGGRFPDNALTAVIFVDDIGKFPGVKALAGKSVDISGPVQLYQGRPEIILKSAEQLKAK
jgi:DNA/RNA endonuclease YhcR with UshA esterase domain